MLHRMTASLRHRSNQLRLVSLLCGLLASAVSYGQDEASPNGFLDSKYFVSVGLFAPDRKVRLGLDASVDLTIPQPDPYVDFSETFDFNSRDETFSAEFGWNFGERWQFRGQYFRIDADQGVELTEDVQWGDYVFGAGTSVAAGTDMQITRLFFGRKFWGSESYEAGLGIGGHILDLSGYINGEATVDGELVGFVQERASVSQPLPNIGGWYRHVFAERWVLKVRLDWLAANVDKYDGHIINGSLGFAYGLSNHFAVGLSYNLFEIDLGIDDTDWQGRVRSRFEGPYLALTGFW